MGLFADIVHLFEMGYGWVFVTAIVLWQLFAPKLLDHDTALAPLVRDLPEKVETIDERQSEMRHQIDDVQGHVEEVQDRQKVQMQVQRAQARATDQMDERKVDGYLLQNGVEPDDFLRGDEMEGYENWSDEEAKTDDGTGIADTLAEDTEEANG